MRFQLKIREFFNSSKLLNLARLTNLNTSPKWSIQNEADNINSFFKIEELEQLQDLFSEAHQVASIIVNPDGMPITKPSKFCGLCHDIIRKTKKGAHNCYQLASKIGEFKLIGLSIKKCSAGLWNAGVAIKLGDKHIANWLIGQVRNKDINEEGIAGYANEIGASKTLLAALLFLNLILSTFYIKRFHSQQVFVT